MKNSLIKGYECRFKSSSISFREEVVVVEKVAIVRFEESIKASILRGLKYLQGIDAFEGPILIKPNICTMSDGTGHSVTDVKLVEALVEIILDSDPEIHIRFVESDSQSKNTIDSFNKFGYLSLRDRKRKEGYDIDIVNLSAEPLVSVNVDGLHYETIDLHEILTKPHYYISVAISKTHETAFLTSSLKNQFGLLPRKGKAAYHSNISKIIVDMNKVVPPNLCIVDARVGVEGWNGPKTRPVGVFIMGRNPVSVDATVMRVMGLDIKRVQHLMLAAETKLGTLIPEVLGERIESVKVQFNAPF